MNKNYYALRRLTFLGEENGFKPYELKGDIYIEFSSGACLTLSNEEVLNRALEYLQSEIESLS